MYLTFLLFSDFFFQRKRLPAIPCDISLKQAIFQLESLTEKQRIYALLALNQGHLDIRYFGCLLSYL